MQTLRELGLRRYMAGKLERRRIPIATKLTLSFLLVIIMTSAIFTFASIRLIDKRIVAEAQETVKRDLNSAREIYMGKLQHINDVVRLTADRYFVREAVSRGDGALVGAFARRQQAWQHLEQRPCGWFWIRPIPR